MKKSRSQQQPKESRVSKPSNAKKTSQKTLVQMMGADALVINSIKKVSNSTDGHSQKLSLCERFNGSGFVTCPICQKSVRYYSIEQHMDTGCMPKTLHFVNAAEPDTVLKEHRPGSIDRLIDEPSASFQSDFEGSESDSNQLSVPQRQNKLSTQRIDSDYEEELKLVQDLIEMAAKSYRNSATYQDLCMDGDFGAAENKMHGAEESASSPTAWPISYSSTFSSGSIKDTYSSEPLKMRLCQKCGDRIPEYKFSQHIHQFCHGENTDYSVQNTLYQLCDAKSTFYGSVGLHGIRVIHDFISEDEESVLVANVDAGCWMPSHHGGNHRSQVYGFIWDRANRRILRENTAPLPTYLNFLFERMRESVVELKEFKPDSTNYIEYDKNKGHSLRLHCDDRQLSGDFVITLSLCCDGFMRFQHDKFNEWELKALLPRRSLLVTSGDGRYNWKHGIMNEDILGKRRVSLNFRETVA